jgi:ribosome recycling factor
MVLNNRCSIISKWRANKCAENFKQAMQKSLNHFKNQLVSIRSGGVSPSVIDTVRVCGQPIGYIASTKRDGNRIAVTPYDTSILHEVESALKKAGFNSYVFSKTTVVVSTSAILTAEEREKTFAQIRRISEETKVTIRNIRKKARQELGKDFDKQIQNETDKFIKEVDELTKVKLNTIQ